MSLQSQDEDWHGQLAAGPLKAEVCYPTPHPHSPCSTLPVRYAAFRWRVSLKQRGPPLPQPTVPSEVALADAQKEQAPCSRDKACCWGALPSLLGTLGQAVASALIALQFEQWDQGPRDSGGARRKLSVAQAGRH